jgi:putative Mg2+ transporter-C (MgtC) family protein
MVFFSEAELEIVTRLLIAVALGALVGYEREVTHRPAGLRTHMLVALGAALFTSVSVMFFQDDPARIAAGIVTGIGFIGAGSIIAMRGQIQGVTTAATLWVVASIGLGVGLGQYLIAVVAAIVVFAILQLRKFEKQIAPSAKGRKGKDAFD